MLNRLKWKLKLYWRLGSKIKSWQKAHDKAWEKEDARNWRRLNRIFLGKAPFKRSGDYEEYFNPFFMKRAINSLVFDQFTEQKPFPRNAGATTTRFTRPS